MLGFYAERLKGARAHCIARTVEEELRNHAVGDFGSTLITIDERGSAVVKDLVAATGAVLKDCPDIFYYETKYTAMRIGDQALLEIRPLYSDQKIEELKTRLDNAIDQILAKIDRHVDTWERERQLFEYLQTHTDYVDSGLPEEHSIVGPLIFGEGVCEGISKTFAVLCHKLGIPCIVVDDSVHMWNMVYIDGEYSYVDLTYATQRGGLCDYAYFNIPDSEMLRKNRDSVNSLPACTSYANSYYYRTGTVFETEKDMERYVHRKLLGRKCVIHTKLKSGDVEKTIKKAKRYVLRNFSYRYDEITNTATIFL